MRWLAVVLLFAVSASAQTRLTVDQLRAFLKSSVDLHHPDKQVADFLRKSKITQKIDAAAYEEFSAMGVGPKTVETLRDLVTTTKDLPPPPAKVTAAAKPPAPGQPPPPAAAPRQGDAKARQ